MGPLIIAVFLQISFLGLVLILVYFQKKESNRFDKEIKDYGWTKVKQNQGFDLLSENEKWRVEFHGSMNTKNQASVIWLHSIPSQTPLGNSIKDRHWYHGRYSNSRFTDAVFQTVGTLNIIFDYD